MTNGRIGLDFNSFEWEFDHDDVNVSCESTDPLKS